MTEKDFNALEEQVEKLIKLSKQLKESNNHLLKKNVDLANREQELTLALNSSKERISKLIKRLKGNRFNG